MKLIINKENIRKQDRSFPLVESIWKAQEENKSFLEWLFNLDEGIYDILADKENEELVLAAMAAQHWRSKKEYIMEYQVHKNVTALHFLGCCAALVHRFFPVFGMPIVEFYGNEKDFTTISVEINPGIPKDKIQQINEIMNSIDMQS